MSNTRFPVRVTTITWFCHTLIWQFDPRTVKVFWNSTDWEIQSELNIEISLWVPGCCQRSETALLQKPETLPARVN